MKAFLFLLLSFFLLLQGYGQSWTKEQLATANTGKDIAYLNATEKEAVMYINLARLYPQQFVKNELQSGYTSEYKKSLIEDLNKRSPTTALQVDKSLYESAKCFAIESGDNGIVGHERKNCPGIKGRYAECCSYGMKNGRDIALQWLVDEDVKSLGHRINCLASFYTKIGISTYTHKIYSYCAVADFTW